MSTIADETLRRHPFTVKDYYRMAEAGILLPDQRVELIAGEIIDMPPIGSRHAGTVDHLSSILRSAVGNLALVRVQHPVDLGEFSEPVPDIDWIAFYFTKVFGEDKWAIHYYAKVLGHELVTRRDLVPVESGHTRARQWYYKVELGPLHHKIPPIVADKWRRITFIFTTGDRFEAAEEIKDLLADQSASGHPFVTLREQQVKFEDDEIG